MEERQARVKRRRALEVGAASEARALCQGQAQQLKAERGSRAQRQRRVRDFLTLKGKSKEELLRERKARVRRRKAAQVGVVGAKESRSGQEEESSDATWAFSAARVVVEISRCDREEADAVAERAALEADLVARQQQEAVEAARAARAAEEAAQQRRDAERVSVRGEVYQAGELDSEVEGSPEAASPGGGGCQLEVGSEREQEEAAGEWRGGGPASECAAGACSSE